MENTKDDFAKRIEKEMTVDYSNALEKNFELAKKFIKISREGSVDVLIKNRLSGPDKIALYLIGKTYAARAKFILSPYVKNEELMNELGIKYGSLRPWLKELRDDDVIVPGKNKGKEVEHSILISAVERILNRINAKTGKA